MSNFNIHKIVAVVGSAGFASSLAYVLGVAGAGQEAEHYLVLIAGAITTVLGIIQGLEKALAGTSGSKTPAGQWTSTSVTTTTPVGGSSSVTLPVTGKDTPTS